MTCHSMEADYEAALVISISTCVHCPGLILMGKVMQHTNKDSYMNENEQ